ncbi:hypothetical protein, conserved [Eimeria brunetti]|uniref:Uncharacterized protein n=1 Tax=Eimeria brunetti TaxID=51314 RepID=U6LNS5_9EIME|nr:hypothetical protein, conserved [Eimeria brunetti]
MTASPTVLRSYRGYLFWLVLQYMACLTVGSDDFYGEQWPMLALGAIWLASELVTKFSWKLNKRSSGSFAQGMEIFYVLAGVAFQKALFASHLVSHPSERAVAHAVAGASKLSFIFFCLPAGELVLLLLMDSLLQLLLFYPPGRSQQEVYSDGSLLFLTDALFTALPLLLYCFGPWFVDNRGPTSGNSQEQEQGQGDAHFVRGPTATVVAAASAKVKGIMCRSCGNEVPLNLTCPPEAPCSPGLEPHAPPGRRRIREDYGELGKDMPCRVGEPSVERLLVSLVVLLLKRNGGSPGEQGSVFDSAPPTPSQVEALRREVKISRGRHPCRGEAAAGRSSLGLRGDTLDGGGFAVPPPNLWDGGRMQKQAMGPIPFAVPPGRIPTMPLQGRGDGAVWICPAGPAAFDLASGELPPRHMHTPFVAEHIISTAYSPQADFVGSPPYGHAQAGPWVTVSDGASKAATGTRNEEWEAFSPPSPPMAPSEGAHQSLLSYLEEQTHKGSQEHPRAAAGAFQAAIPIVAAASRPARAAAAPVLVIKKRASSQPPSHKAPRSTVLFGTSSNPPDRLLAQATPKAEQKTTHDGEPNSPEISSDNSLERDLAMLIQALGQARQGDTNGSALGEGPRGASSTGGPASAAAAGGTGGQPLTGQLHLHKEGNLHNSTQSSDSHVISQPFVERMTYKRGQETPFAQNGHYYYQQVSSGPERDPQQHQKQQQLLQHHLLHHQKQQEQHAAQHQQQQHHHLGFSGSTRGSISSGGQGGSERSAPLQPQLGVMRAAMDPALPIVLQQLTGREQRQQPPASSTDPNNQKSKQERGAEYGHACNAAAGPASPVHRSAVLDPFAAADEQHKPSPSVVWGRSKAIGANGTPMVSPRKRDRTSSLGPGGAGLPDVADGRIKSGLLPCGPERHFPRSPSAAPRGDKGEGPRGEGVGEEDWLGRGACMHAGPKHFFGTPAPPPRDHAPMQENHTGNTAEQAYQKLHDFAMWRRGRPKGSVGGEAAAGGPRVQPHPTPANLPEPRACMPVRHIAGHGEQDKHLCAPRAASAGRSGKGIGEQGPGGMLPPARRGASAAEGPSTPGGPPHLLILKPGESSQLPSPQGGSSSRLSSSGSARPIEPCCPRHSSPTPAPAEETAGRRQHPPCRGPQQQRVLHANNGNSWESWEPLLQEGTEGFCLPGASVRASRLRAESNEGDEGL